jgi:hypothetical protein
MDDQGNRSNQRWKEYVGDGDGRLIICLEQGFYGFISPCNTRGGGWERRKVDPEHEYSLV